MQVHNDSNKLEFLFFFPKISRNVERASETPTGLHFSAHNYKFFFWEGRQQFYATYQCMETMQEDKSPYFWTDNPTPINIQIRK